MCDGAFVGSSDVTSVSIPSTIRSICNEAFANCVGISAMTVAVDDPQWIILGNNVFEGMDKENCTLYVPVGSKVLYEAAEQWKGFGKIEEIGAGLEEVEIDLTDDAPYYDLMGRRVDNPTNGLYIHNGHKVLVK